MQMEFDIIVMVMLQFCQNFVADEGAKSFKPRKGYPLEILFSMFLFLVCIVIQDMKL